jgi:hypothetical protein
LFLFPKSEKEYFEFYDLTNNKNNTELFLNRYDKMKIAAFKDSCGSLKYFLFMSQFVDGEFAESYFDDASFIIDRNTQKFCDLYIKYGSRELKIFSQEYEDDCK